MGKTCQNAENKQTFALTGKDEILKLRQKTCQNAENKQTFDLALWQPKIESNEKTRQNDLSYYYLHTDSK